ncbi:MAG: type II toxin-antitoxin system VapB family antitoxin [Litorimonas sp.]
MTLDEARLDRAKELTGIENRTELLKTALDALIAHHAARRLVLLGGTDPDAASAPRRRSHLPEDVEPPEGRSS